MQKDYAAFFRKKARKKVVFVCMFIKSSHSYCFIFLQIMV